MKKIRLTNVETVMEKGNIFLDVTYEFENFRGVHECRFPRVLVPLYKEDGDFVLTACADGEHEHMIDIGYGLTPFYEDENGRCFIDKIIKPATRKMSVEEIEKELGYPIEIVFDERTKIEKDKYCKNCKHVFFNMYKNNMECDLSRPEYNHKKGCCSEFIYSNTKGED